MEMTTQELSCKNDDCTMTFTCEDQMISHEKRHEMVLNLGPLKGNLFNTDQTPTPTRFIRNCDEVGLFQDLQNVNPFEETFRRAVEQNRSGVTPSLVPPLSNTLNDDTLHTPHIFPNYNNITENSFGVRVSEGQSANNIDAPNERSFVSDDKRINVIKQTEINREISTKTNQIIAPKETIHKINHVINVTGNNMLLPVLEQIHISDDVAEQLIASNNLDLQNQTTNNDISCVKKQLKASILKNTQQVQVNTPSRPSIIRCVQSVSPLIISNTSPTSNNLRNILPKKIPELKRQLSDKQINKVKIKTQKLKDNETYQKTKRSEKQQNLNNNEKVQTKNDEDEQRQQFLARNRAAASRWRVKKREQIRELIRRNQQLEYENTTLKTECAELKKMLLSHKNCSIAVPHSMIAGPAAAAMNSFTSPNIQSSTINKITIINNVQSINSSQNM